MKYIRTKDGIYLNGGKFGKPYSGIVGKKHEYDFGYCFNKKDIIKQADTIEKLIDELLFVTEYGNFTLKLDDLDKHAEGQTKEMLEEGQLECFGAIWIKGEHGEPILKSVAKMNKGKLELL